MGKGDTAAPCALAVRALLDAAGLLIVRRIKQLLCDLLHFALLAPELLHHIIAHAHLQVVVVLVHLHRHSLWWHSKGRGRGKPC